MSSAERSAIRLLRTGIVPLSALDSLSVGYDRIRSDFTAGLETFLSGSPQTPRFVNGEWGTGKSHFLSYCRMLATRAGVPTAYVSLNARTVPLNYPQRIYSEIAAGLRVGPVAGLRPLLHSLLVAPSTRSKLKACWRKPLVVFAVITSEIKFSTPTVNCCGPLCWARISDGQTTSTSANRLWIELKSYPSVFVPRMEAA